MIVERQTERGFRGGCEFGSPAHAIIGITKAAALEGASHGIRVNVVAPGFTQTAMYERVTGSDAVRGAVTSVLPLIGPAARRRSPTP